MYKYIYMYPDSSKHLSYEIDDAIYWFSNAFDPLNNWSAHAVKIWGMNFPTVEHAYHYRKYSETAPDVAKKIMAAPSPWAAKQVDRSYLSKRCKNWYEINLNVMIELNRAKIDQNEDVRLCLLKTGDRQLFENSPWDKFWGVGEDGTGENHMGKILMQIRDELRTTQKKNKP